MPVTIAPIKTTDPKKPAVQQAMDQIARYYGTNFITVDTRRAMEEMLREGNAMMMAIRDDDNREIVGASFCLLHPRTKDMPAVGMMMYESSPQALRQRLLDASCREVRSRLGENTPMLFVGRRDWLEKDEKRGLRLIHYDSPELPGDTAKQKSERYVWCEDDAKGPGYHWMIYGNQQPSAAELKTGILLQRNCVVRELDPDDINPKKKLGEQLSASAREDYDVDESLRHVDRMAKKGIMDLVPIQKNISLKL